MPCRKVAPFGGESHEVAEGERKTPPRKHSAGDGYVSGFISEIPPDGLF